MNTYCVTYYESREAMTPTPEQIKWAEKYDNIPNYNWDNHKHVTVKATTLGGAYRAFTMSNKGIVVAIEDSRTYRNYTVIG